MTVSLVHLVIRKSRIREDCTFLDVELRRIVVEKNNEDSLIVGSDNILLFNKSLFLFSAKQKKGTNLIN